MTMEDAQKIVLGGIVMSTSLASSLSSSALSFLLSLISY